MECWKQGCKNKVKTLCKCVNPASYSCSNHIYEHLQNSFLQEHHLELLKLKINPENKKTLVEELNKLSNELFDIKKNLVKETYKKIEELKLKLVKSLENIDKMRINQAELIRKIHSINSIPINNQNPIENLLSLDLDSARKKLNEFWCNRNDTVEANEIVFFRASTKNSVRVNLNNFSKSEQQVGILQSNITHPHCISMCLLPDKSIFCYGNYPGIGTAFILYPDRITKQLSDGDPSGNMGAVYHDGFIYLFGGCNSAGGTWNQAGKYELSTDKWYKICLLREALSNVSCLAGNYGIIFVAYQSSKLYSYSHNEDTYNEIYLNFALNTYKVLLQAENRIFLVESSKNIYETEPNQLSNWKVIGTLQISFSAGAAYQVYFNHNCYFMDYTSKIYKFDMSNLQLMMTCV